MINKEKIFNDTYKPERASKTHDLCTRYEVMSQPWIKILDPEPIDERLLMLFHEPDYIRLLQEASRGEVRLGMPELGMDALNRLSNQRIAYVDFDAHHGNGVQEAFYTNPRVLVIFLHETGRTLYPWSGSEKR
jgi:acetoin utilization deacetylase AcuC-like enzyme